MEGTNTQHNTGFTCRTCGEAADVDMNDGSYLCAADAIKSMATVNPRAVVNRRHRRTYSDYLNLRR